MRRSQHLPALGMLVLGAAAAGGAALFLTRGQGEVSAHPRETARGSFEAEEQEPWPDPAAAAAESETARHYSGAVIPLVLEEGGERRRSDSSPDLRLVQRISGGLISADNLELRLEPDQILQGVEMIRVGGSASLRAALEGASEGKADDGRP